MNIKVTAINVRLPAELVSWLDTLVEKGLYKSRSEAIREQVRSYVHEKTRSKTGK
ncbi:ribbon-helix-helix protein, CopG family [Candidatus Woesearchaeota archaeon]|nr:ribbon-helix-helix protein, CopG family [Candidatus Woesearchaeota archaeon]